MATNKRAKAMSYLLVIPSAPPSPQSPPNEDYDNENNYRRRTAAWLPPINCTCLCSCLGGLTLVTLLIMAIVIPLIVTTSTFMNEISSTNTASVTTITTVTTTTATTATISSTSTTNITSSSYITSITSTSTTTSSTSTSTTSVTSTTSKTTSTTSTTTTTSSTSTSTTTGTTAITTVPTCTKWNSSSSGVLATQKGTNPSFWTLYNYTYVAVTISPILTFAFVTDYVTAPSVQLLNNPSFETSTTLLTGWIVWCNQTCSAGSGGQVTWGTNCYASTGNCFSADCPDTGSGAIVFLGQSFPATVGNTYKLSFRMRMAYGGGGSSLTQFAVAIR